MKVTNISTPSKKGSAKPKSTDVVPFESGLPHIGNIRAVIGSVRLVFFF